MILRICEAVYCKSFASLPPWIVTGAGHGRSRVPLNMAVVTDPAHLGRDELIDE
jgi:hypothetical protein